MFKNYVKVALRNIYRNKLYSFINILGLSVGLACVFMILLVVQGELKFNSHNTNIDRIYRINKRYTVGDQISVNRATPYALADVAKDQFPEILESTHFVNTRQVIKYNDNTIRENDICFASPSIFNVFTFDFVKGDPKDCIADESSVVISQSIAHKFFGDEDPLGKSMLFNNQNERVVTAIVKDMPDLSDYKFNCIINMEAITEEEERGDWHSHWMETYILLKEDVDVAQLDKKINDLMSTRIGERTGGRLQALGDIHLYSVEGEPTMQRYIYIFSVVAIFVLIISCINFVNLAIAQASKRYKEVAMRKVAGADKRSLIIQYIGESLVFMVIALMFALVFVELSMPTFENIIGRPISHNLLSWGSLLLLMGILVVVGIGAGSYPAFVLSSFSPIRALKSNLAIGGKGYLLRSIIVVLQFTLAISLIIGTGVIYSQIKYMQTKNLGFDKENLIYLQWNPYIAEQYDEFKHLCTKIPEVTNITRSSATPDEVWSIMRGVTWEGCENPEGSAFGFIASDCDFIKTVKLELVQGRNFSQDFATDNDKVIINQAAAKMIGIEDPIGLKFNDGEVIGVVKDFNSLPLTHTIEPLFIAIMPEYYNNLLIRIQGNNIPETLKSIERAWLTIAPDFPFEYRFVDKKFEHLYRSEIQASNLFFIFATLGIFIACMGLFGLASLMTEQRTKEIGIRKVLGASVKNVVFLVSQTFIKWVLAANVIAWPIAYFVMNRWLQNFAYRTNIGLKIFILSGTIALFIAICTVSFQAIKAAIGNPVDALKYE